eukprot:m.67288 g.67288  ORF g.67288 m.67288 type:complete len:265 (-) comp11876_c0_seq1:158-952(-)
MMAASAAFSSMSTPESWLFPRENLVNTPSRRDNIDEEREKRYRREGASFIKKAATRLNMGSTVYNTGIVFYHRFYTLNSYKNYERWNMAIACLFVAGKVGEQPKKLKDLLPAVNQCLPRPYKQEQMMELRSRILGHERVLLASLCFDLSVEHPSRFLFKFAKQLSVLNGSKIPNELVQKAFQLIDDSYKTTVCVEFSPDVIALAMLNLASKFPGQFNLEPLSAKEGKPWWSTFIERNVEEEINYICNRVLDIYEKKKNSVPKPK